jgi:hypothetical protein
MFICDQLLKKKGTNVACHTIIKVINNIRKITVKFRIFKCKTSVQTLVMRGKWAQTVYYRQALCLPRSISLMAYLLLNGVNAEMHIGFRMEPPRLFHAWVEVEGEPINDLKERVFEYVTLVTYPISDKIL